MLTRHIRMFHPRGSDELNAPNFTAPVASPSQVAEQRETFRSVQTSHPDDEQSQQNVTTREPGNDHSMASPNGLSQNSIQADENNAFDVSNQADLTALAPDTALGQSFLWDDTDDLEFLWNDMQPWSNVLPASFFDTTLSLTDLSQQYS